MTREQVTAEFTVDCIGPYNPEELYWLSKPRRGIRGFSIQSTVISTVNNFVDYNNFVTTGAYLP